MLPALFLEHCFHCLIHHFPGDEKKAQSRLMYKLNIIISDQRFGGKLHKPFSMGTGFELINFSKWSWTDFLYTCLHFYSLTINLNAFKLLGSACVPSYYYVFQNLRHNESRPVNWASTLVNVLREKVFYRIHLYDLVTCFHVNTNSFNFQRERIFLKNTFSIHSTLLSDFFYSVLIRKQRERVCDIYCKGNTYPS